MSKRTKSVIALLLSIVACCCCVVSGTDRPLPPPEPKNDVHQHQPIRKQQAQTPLPKRTSTVD